MTDHVVVNGVRYYPESTGRHSVGVGITTHNRHDVLAETLAAFKKFSPDIPIVIVDDGSTVPVDDPRALRNEVPQGIPAGKNKCIAALMDMGVEHLFLFDDDTRPADEEWWKPYVDGPEPHYTYCWTKFAKTNQPVSRMNVVYEDDTIIAYEWSMGCMLYVHRDAVNRVGGMRLEFGMGMEEHGEWSQRINNAGLTTFVHQDVPGASKLIWAADEYNAVARSFKTGERNELLARNEKIRLSYIDDDSFVDYRATRNVVVASYFTSHADPQRKKTLPKDPAALVILESTNAVILHDGLDLACENYVVPTPLVAYTQRWISEWQWLRAHPEVDFVWLVDATDVRMLNDPFPHMQRGTLYAGWENQVVGCEWIRAHSASAPEWIEEHAQDILLNCGVVGGDRNTVMALCHTMIQLWADSGSTDPLEEMMFFNIAARKHSRLVTGRQVCTVFKSNIISDEISWFAHK